MKEKEQKITYVMKKKSIPLKPQGFNIPRDIVLVKSKIHFLSKLHGRVVSLLFLTLQNIEWNNNVISFSKNLRDELCSKTGISSAGLSNCLGELCKYGVFKKLSNNIYEYNPHLFYYADESVVSKWRERWNCDFDDDKCEIKVKIIQYEKEQNK